MAIASEERVPQELLSPNDTIFELEPLGLDERRFSETIQRQFDVAFSEDDLYATIFNVYAGDDWSISLSNVLRIINSRRKMLEDDVEGPGNSEKTPHERKRPE